MNYSLDEITTLEQFEELLLPQRGKTDETISEKEELDITKLRFVLYARRSTRGKKEKNKDSDSKEGQERSIGDQLAECFDVQRKLKLNIVKIWKEKQSAKEPDIRDDFRDMITDLKANKYDAIIAWHPDRLARNMKDAGEIIDLIDRGVIKHIVFATYTFENNATGKMLLGISFVLSKQFSDALSVNIKRGQQRSMKEGKYLVAQVHGYYKHEGRFFPDGDNFRLIKNAFDMRLDGYTNLQIADFLNKNHYKASRKGKPVEFRMEKKRVGEFLKNPIYIGIAVFGDKWMNLTQLYDFEPMIEVVEFIKINKATKNDLKMLGSKFLLNKRNRSKQLIEADFLRDMIICIGCTEAMSSGITTTKNSRGEKTNRYYYRCETQGCELYNKSVRPKVILDFVYDFLEKHHFDTEEAYQNYRDDMGLYIRDSNNEDQNAINRLKRELIEQNKSYKKTKETYNTGDATIKEHFKGELDQSLAEIKDTEKEIDWYNGRLAERTDTILTFENYLELYGNVSVKLRKIKDYELKQEIIKKFFSNFTLQGRLPVKERGITRWKLVGYELNEPFAGFVKIGKVRDVSLR